MIILDTAGDTIQAEASAASSITVSCYGIETASGTDTYKRLGVAQLTGSGTQDTIYTVPASTVTICSMIVIANTSGSARNIKLWDVENGGSPGDANAILGTVTILANSSILWNRGNITEIPNATGGAGTDFTSRCSVYLSGDQTINVLTFTKITFDSEDYDVDSEFDTTNNKFVVTTTGYYTVHYRVIGLAFNDGKFIRCILYKNKGEGSEESLMDTIQYSTLTTSGVYMPCSDDVYLEAGDELELWFYHNGGATQDINGGTLQRSTLSIHRFA